MGSGSSRYRAFISYSQKDKRAARRLHKALEGFRVPSGIQSSRLEAKSTRLGRFFRDEEEMGAAANLGDALRDAIANSESLLVICSRNAAVSEWVNKEIVHFKKTGRSRNIFAVIVDGDPNAPTSAASGESPLECFPPALRFEVNEDGAVTETRAEPLAIDMRREKFSRVRARIVAGLLDVNFDDLWQRERRRTRNRNVVAAVAVLLLGVSAGGGIYQSAMTVRAAQKAEESERARAEENRRDALRQRAIAAVVASEALADEYVDDEENFGQEAPANDKQHEAARWNAAALTYAMALSGDEVSAGPLLNRLGYVRAHIYSGMATVDSDYLVPSEDWSRLASTYDEVLFDRFGGTIDLNPPDAIGARMVSSPSRRQMLVSEEEQQFFGGEIDRVGIWDLNTGVRVGEISSQLLGRSGIMNFDSTGELVAVAGYGRLEVWDLGKQELVEDAVFGKPVLEPSWTKSYSNVSPANNVWFAKGDSHIHVLDQDDRIWTYDRQNKTWIDAPLRIGPEDDITPLEQAAPDQGRLVYQARSRIGEVYETRLEVADTQSGEVLLEVRPWRCPKPGTDWCEVSLLGSTSDGRYLTVVDYASSIEESGPGPEAIRIFDLAVSGKPTEINRPEDCIQSGERYPCKLHPYAVSPDSPRLASSGGDGVVRMFDMASGSINGQMSAHGSVDVIAFSPDGGLLVGVARKADGSAGFGRIWVWNAETGEALSRSGSVGRTGFLKVDTAARRVLSEGNSFDSAIVWEALSPAAESPAAAVKRLCALRGTQGLVVSEQDQSALPAGASPNICTW